MTKHLPTSVSNHLVFIMLLIICLAGAVPDAFATPLPQPATTELKIGYQPFSSPTGAIFETLKRDRLLRSELQKLKIALTFVPALKGPESIAQFKRNELDAVALGDMPLIELALTRPVTVIAQTRQSFTTIVAARGTLPQDLKGKRVGNIFATTAHYGLLQTLHRNGLNEHDVILVPLEVNQMPDALLQGKVDAFSVWEPIPSLLISQHPNRFSSVGRQTSSGYVSVARSFASQHPEGVRLLAAGIARAMQWLSKNEGNRQQAITWYKGAMQKLSSKPLTLTTAELSRQLNAELQSMRYSTKLPNIRSQGSKLLQSEFNFLKKLDKLPRDAQWETVQSSFDHSIMEYIYANPDKTSLNRFEYESR